MSMTRNKIEDAIEEARRFIVRAQAALERLDVEKSGYGYRDDSVWKRKPADYSYGSAETGALRRTSLDLTRTLAELRK